MVETTSENFSITINSTEYGTYVDSFEESGGTPMYKEIRPWNNSRYKVLKGYEDWELKINMLADADTDGFIQAFQAGATTYTIVIGYASGYQVTYSNMKAEEYSYKMSTTDNIGIATLTFIARGIRSNRVQTVN